jgi:hypothetical protein
MSRKVYIVILALIGGIFSGVAGYAAGTAGSANPDPPPPSCKCSCGGTNWSPGTTACLGGARMVCSDRPAGSGKKCGWDQLGPNCSGGELCSSTAPNVGGYY